MMPSDHLRVALAWWPAGIVPLIEAMDFRVVDLAAESFVDVDGSPADLKDVALRMQGEQVHVLAYVRAASQEARGEVPAGTIAGWTGAGDRVIPLAEQAAALWNGGADGDRFPLDGRRIRYLFQSSRGTLNPILRAVGLVPHWPGNPVEPELRGPGGEVTDLDEALRRIEARPELAKLLREALYQRWMDISHSGDDRGLTFPH
jgi:hypothetical protein